ncbi:MAG: hypothetical protein KY466_16350 [Gemmatimonadetes bacterium]|nr:hypothetical protein [Gemmatimonadota bacterium]
MTAPALLGAVAALAAVWLSGAAVAGLAGIREGRPRDLPLDMALGSVLLAFAGSLALIAGARVTIPLAAAVLASPVVAALVMGRLRLRVAAPLPGDRLSRALLGLGLVVMAVVLTAALRDRLTWDGWAFWTLKATMLFRDGTLPADLFDPAGPYDYAHADYPPGLPLLYWWVFRAAGAPAPALASFTGALWFVLIPVLFWDSARAHARPELAALGAVAVAAFWPIGRYATGGQADVLISLAALGIVVHLADARTAGVAALWRAGAFAAFGAMMKNEGVALAAAAVVAVVAWLLLRKELTSRRILPLAGPILLALPWAIWVRARGVGAEHLGGGFDLPELPDRTVLILRELAALAVYRSWVPVAAIAVAALVLALRRRRSLALRLPAGVLAVYFATAIVVYLRAARDLQWLLETSLDRVVSGVVPAVAFLAISGAARADLPRLSYGTADRSFRERAGRQVPGPIDTEDHPA